MPFFESQTADVAPLLATVAYRIKVCVIASPERCSPYMNVQFDTP